jgi:hypothetical protein
MFNAFPNTVFRYCSAAEDVVVANPNDNKAWCPECAVAHRASTLSQATPEQIKRFAAQPLRPPS